MDKNKKRKIKNLVAVVIVLVAGSFISAYVPKAQAEQKQKTDLHVQVQESSYDLEAEKEQRLLQKVKAQEEIRQQEEIEEILRLREEDKEMQKKLEEEEAKAKKEAEEKEILQKAQKEEDINVLATTAFKEVGIFYAEEYAEKYNISKEDADEAVYLTMSVIVHRTWRHHLGATTIRKTVMTKEYHSKTREAVQNNEKVPEKFYEMAREIVENGSIGPENLIFQDTKQWGKLYKKIGPMYFGLDEK